MPKNNPTPQKSNPSHPSVAKEKKNIGGARPNSGRKPIAEKTAQITITLPEQHARIIKEKKLQNKIRAAIARIIKRH